MEKMRRARINESLNELKSLVLEAMKKDVSHLLFANESLKAIGPDSVMRKLHICLVVG